MTEDAFIARVAGLVAAALVNVGSGKPAGDVIADAALYEQHIGEGLPIED